MSLFSPVVRQHLLGFKHPFCMLTRIDRKSSTMRSTPITHHISLEAKFTLQKIVLRLAVLAAVGLVQAIVAAHHTGNANLDSLCERPQIQLMHRAVIDVGAHALDSGAIGVGRWLSLSLLFVADVV